MKEVIEFFVVKNENGQYFRSTKSSTRKSIYTDDVNEANTYGKLSTAKMIARSYGPIVVRLEAISVDEINFKDEFEEKLRIKKTEATSPA
jgi:hypothetical protein